MSQVDSAGNNLRAARAIGLATTPQTFSDFVGSSDLEDYYRFTLGSRSAIDVSLTRLQANVNLQLLNGSGVALATVAQPGAVSEAYQSTLDPGTYFLRVFPANARLSSRYSLTISATADPGNSLATARAIGPITTPQVFSDRVGVSDTDDFYSFNLAQAGQFGSSISGLSADANLQIVQDSNGNGAFEPFEAIVGSYNAGAANDVVSQALAAGNYFVRVVGGADTSYTLALWHNPAPVVTANAPLTLDEGGTAILNNGFLQAADPDGTGPAQLTYRLTNPALNGSLRLNGVALSTGSVFSQADVTAGRLSYRHNSSDTLSDRFTLSLTDGASTVAPIVFNINVVPVIDPTSLPLGQTFRGTLSPTDAKDLSRPDQFYDDYRLTGIRPGQKIQVDLSSTVFDTDLQLLNADTGIVIDQNDDARGSNSQLSWTAQPGVNYLLRASSFTAEATGAYTIAVAEVLPQPDAAGNTLATARPIATEGALARYSDRVGNGDPVDYYRFDLTSAKTVNLVLDDFNNSAVTVSLLDGAGTPLITENAVRDQLSLSRSLPGGSYYVRVVPSASTSNSPYRLSLLAAVDAGDSLDTASELLLNPAPPAVAAASTSPATVRSASSNSASLSSASLNTASLNTAPIAPPLLPVVTVAPAPSTVQAAAVGYLDEEDVYDTYRFTIANPGTFRLRLDNLSTPVSTVLFDSQGNLLASALQTGSDVRTISKAVTAGTYYVQLSQTEAGSTFFNLSLAVDSPPAIANSAVAVSNAQSASGGVIVPAKPIQAE